MEPNSGAVHRVQLLSVLLVLVGLVARLAVAWPAAGRTLDDPDNYLPLAQSIASGSGMTQHGRPTAYRPPLYPVVLAALVRACGTGPTLHQAVALLHATLGAGMVALTLTAARRAFRNELPRYLTGALVALDPVLVGQSRAIMTETLTAFLLAAALALVFQLHPRSLVGAGLCLGLAALCRPSTLAGSLLIAGAAAVAGSEQARLRWRRTLFIVLGLMLPLVPWALRNARALGTPIWTTTHGGYTLYLANNPEYYADVLNGPLDAVWQGPGQRRWAVRANQEAAGLSEVEADRLWRGRAGAFIRAHPWDFARATAARLGRFWAIMPTAAVYSLPLRIVTAIWTIPFWLLVVVGLFSAQTIRWPRVVPVAMILGLTLVHAVFWTDLRMRAPIVPALALLAGFGLERLAKLPNRQEGNHLGEIEPCR